jgi:hypothetical protein
MVAPLMQLLTASMEVLQYLRPPSVLDFSAGGHYSQGWATCFANVGDLVSLLVSDWSSTGDLGNRYAEDATAFRALLAPALPLLAHTAAKFEGIHQLTAQPSNLPAPPPAASSVGAIPADSALLLLMGASAVVERCVAVGLVSAAAHDIVSGVSAGTGQSSSSASQASSIGARTAGNQAGLTAAQEPSGDDLMAAFKSLLSLANLLVSDGPWWEEARAKYPLLLIEALFKVGTVSHCWVLCMLAAANATISVQCIWC